MSNLVARPLVSFSPGSAPGGWCMYRLGDLGMSRLQCSVPQEPGCPGCEYSTLFPHMFVAAALIALCFGWEIFPRLCLSKLSNVDDLIWHLLHIKWQLVCSKLTIPPHGWHSCG